MPDPTPIQQHRNAMNGLDCVAAELSTLASAFELTGNDRIAANLWRLSRDLRGAQGEAKSAFDRLFNQLFHETEQASANMLAAALAVAEMNQPKEFTP